MWRPVLRLQLAILAPSERPPGFCLLYFACSDPLCRQKDSKDGRFTQIVSNVLDTKLREDLERLKKIRCATHPLGFLEVLDVLLGHLG